MERSGEVGALGLFEVLMSVAYGKAKAWNGKPFHNICFDVREGTHVWFWHDKWCGDGDPRPALGLGHLGDCLGPPTRERPPNFGAKIEIYIFLKYFF